MGAQNKMLVV